MKWVKYKEGQPIEEFDTLRELQKSLKEDELVVAIKFSAVNLPLEIRLVTKHESCPISREELEWLYKKEHLR